MKKLKYGLLLGLGMVLLSGCNASAGGNIDEKRWVDNASCEIFEVTDPLLINKNLCYAMKKFGSIRKFKKAAKKHKSIFGWTVYNPMQYIPMFKALSKAKNDKERRNVKSGIKKLFKFNFFDETEFATVKDKDLIRDFADNMKLLWDYNSIDFDFEPNWLKFPLMKYGAINY